MIADVALLSAAPVVLIDEIENAGVDRRGALSLLAGADKIVLVSTHDPVFALLGDRRLVIANGAVAQVRTASEKERENLAILARYDRQVTALREQIRQGGAVDQPDLAAWLLGPESGGALAYGPAPRQMGPGDFCSCQRDARWDPVPSDGGKADKTARCTGKPGTAGCFWLPLGGPRRAGVVPPWATGRTWSMAGWQSDGD